jgi:monoterpene epsilon-lactone hydrolase
VSLSGQAPVGPTSVGPTGALATRVILVSVTDGPARVLPFPAASDGIELRHVRSFVAVAEELNFRRAAERLYITQPALSRQIRALERLVGAQLLRRSTHRVELTLAGEALLGRARRLLSDVDDAVHAVRSIGGEISARIMRLWQPVAHHAGEPGAPGDLQEQRTAYEAMLAHVEVPAGVHVRPVNAGGVPALLVAKDPQDRPNMLYLHGGVFVFGSAFGYRPLAGALALASGCSVLVADYRLAPEHPFPAALDDAHATYLWMLERGADPAQLVVAGDSTGGGLGLALLLRLRDEGVPLPAGAALLCPSADAGLSWVIGADTEDPARRAFIAIGRRCIDAYLAGHSSLDPLVSPLLGDLSGLPPLLIQAAAEDLLIGDAQALCERAHEHGVQAELQLYPSDAHDFQLFWSFLPEAADAIEAAGKFMSTLTATGSDAENAG